MNKYLPYLLIVVLALGMPAPANGGGAAAPGGPDRLPGISGELSLPEAGKGGQAAIPLAELLNPDGTLRLSGGRAGSIDLSGWQMVSPPGAAPRFAPADAAPGTAAPESALPPDGNPGNTNWSEVGQVILPMGGGMNSEVFALAVDSSGNLYAGGTFDSAGSCYSGCNFIAKWNGSTWSSMGGGMNERVLALAVDASDNLYAGGWFTSAGSCTSGCSRIAKWNGSAWSALGSGTNGIVYDIALDGSGNLYAGGAFSSAGSCASGCNNIAKWSGSAWSALGSGTDNSVGALAFDSSRSLLYAGGGFTSAGSCGSINGCNYIAQWNGSAWSNVGGGAGWVVYDLLMDAEYNLYAGGKFTAIGSCSSGCSHVAKWNGSAWSALGSGTNNDVNRLAVDSSGNLYASGHFTQAGSCTSNCNYIARWDGSTWRAMGSGLDLDGGPLAFDRRGRLYVGGYFAYAGGERANYITHWTAGEGKCGLSTGGDHTFYSGNRPVQVHVNSPGTLDCLAVQRFNNHHASAGSPQQTGYYWSLRGLDSSNAPAAGFDLSLTLPYASAGDGDRLCRYDTGTASWVCANDHSYVPNTSVTQLHVTQFSDWAVGDFPPSVTLTASKTGAGGGTLSSSPAGIDCGADCQEDYDYGATVTLTATAQADSLFSGWSGACSGSSSCTLEMTQPRLVTATFTLKTYTLTVSKAGPGSGTVSSNPAGIDCGADCGETFTIGATVTLTATADAGSLFAGWDGACSGSGPCVVSMDQDQPVTAIFHRLYYFPLIRS